MKQNFEIDEFLQSSILAMKDFVFLAFLKTDFILLIKLLTSRSEIFCLPQTLC